MNKYIKTKSYKNFTIKVMNIVEHYHFFMQESFKLEDKVNNNVQNSKKDNIVQSTSLLYYNLFDGNTNIARTKMITRKERLNNIFYQRNRQIQYFFLEVVEVYQKYLINLYDEILKDKQNFIIEKDLTYTKVLNKLRINIDNFVKYETENALNINFKLKFTLFIKLRNIITHNNGIIKNKEILINNIIKESGYACDIKNIKLIKSYFQLDNDNYLIMFERKEQETKLDLKQFIENDYGKVFIDEIVSYVSMIDSLIYSKYSGENKC